MTALCLFVASGCAKDGYSGPTGTVQGTVTLAGEPVSTGMIFFIGKSLTDTASAELQPDGSYTLQYGKGFSIPAADYQVCLGASGATSEIPDPMKLMEAPEKFTPVLPAVPEKYLSAETSGLIASVKAGQNTLDFDLKKAK